MMNKKILNIILFGFLFMYLNEVKAQQVPFYNHHITNPVVYNPAFAGADGDVNAYITRGQRYMGIGSGAVDNTFSIEGRFFVPNSGFGLFIGHQSAGVMNQLSAKLAYSYRVKFGEDHNLTFGVSGGYLENRIRTQEFNVLHNDDPFLTGMHNYRPSYDVSAGLLYKWKDLQIGVSVPQLVGNKIKFSKEKTRGYYTLARHFLGTASYDFKFDAVPKITLTPHALVRYIPGAPLQYDVAAQLKYENIGWFSATYKSDYAVQFNLGFHILKQLHVGYSYELVVGSIRNYYAGVNHEFLLGYTFRTGKTKTEIRRVEVKVPDPKVVEENEELRRQLKAKEDLERRLREQLAQEKRMRDSLAAIPPKEEESDNSVLQSGEDHSFVEVDGADSPGGYYVIIGVYSEKNNLNKNINKAKELYPDTYYIINTKKSNYNYIVILYTFDRKEAVRTLNDYTNKTGRKGWVLKYEL